MSACLIVGVRVQFVLRIMVHRNDAFFSLFGTSGARARAIDRTTRHYCPTFHLSISPASAHACVCKQHVCREATNVVCRNPIHLLVLVFPSQRWNYRRSSRVVCYLFYKSVMFACPLIFYAYNNGYRCVCRYHQRTNRSHGVRKLPRPFVGDATTGHASTRCQRCNLQTISFAQRIRSFSGRSCRLPLGLAPVFS